MSLSENIIPFGYYAPLFRYHKKSDACILRPLPNFNFILNSYYSRASLPTNMYVKDDIIHLLISVVGCTKENVEVSLNSGYLSVLTKPDASKSENYIFNEFATKQRRVYVVPNNVKLEDLDIEFNGEMLHIQIPMKKGYKTERFNF